MPTKPASTEEYLATLAEPQRATLLALRETIRAAAPGATEAFSYGMPAFALDGRPFVWYAAWKRFYSLYPMGPSIVRSAGPAAAAYQTARGTIRFPATEPLPHALVTRLVEARAEELRERGK